MALNKISPKELYEKMKQEKVTLLDVRAEEKYKAYHLEGSNIESLNIPKTNIINHTFDAEIISLPKEKEIIVTCTTGNSAARCAAILSEKEYNATVLVGGITAWKEFIKYE
ncbi:rhodanese-like domain-containing protein [Cytobacillus oceanisediminis]|uniref:rhodanese-like domain-containing protein n=1 Tax=Cytobacillus oceanisediminis TaxID=665099 RepID=UPI0023DBA8EE|nr:rhodanese-like domain-containing protein [Cytobacillus oceanisediminis]MDF2039936.1 rhodanese-like domain-containing protein [Cytobacillus oceanisediminis]